MVKKLGAFLLFAGAILLLSACAQPAATATPAAAATKAPGAAATTAPAAATATTAPVAPTATQAPKPKVGGTLKWATNSDSYGIDPAGPSGAVSYGGAGRAAREIFNGLMQYEPETQKLLPELATEWSVSADGKEITFKLRPGVKFHDGTPFNAAAVKFNFERLVGIVDPKKVSRFKNNYGQLERVDVVDDLTAKFVLKKPQASLLNFLGDPSGFISSPTAYQKDPVGYQRAVVGTGPMKLKEWTKDLRLVMEKNADYWEKDKDGNKYPYLDSIIMTPITDTTVQIANVRTGTMDYAEEIAPQEVARVRSDSNLVYYERPSFGMEPIYPIHDKPPFNNQACREAFFGAIDKAAISKAVYFDVSKPSETIISPASAYFDPNTKGIPFDLNRAKQKLAECGKPDGYELDIYTMSLPRIVNRMEAIQAQVAKVGIKVNVIVKDITGVVTAVVTEHQGNAMAIYEGSYSDPTHYLGNFQCSNAGNWEKMCYPELDKMFDEAEAAFDFNKRKAIIQDIAKYISHTPWMWPVVHNPENAIALKKVKGIRQGPQLLQQFKWVWLE